MRWEEFSAACPEIARLAEDRFRKDELVLLGTIRRDGHPRISPCEVDLAAGYLFLGMMWRSKKALDLLRDPRILVHSVTCDKAGADGDIKLSGRAVEILDPDPRRSFRDAIRSRIGWAPEEPNYHLFSLEVESAGYIVFGDERRVLTWDRLRGLQRPPFPDSG